MAMSRKDVEKLRDGQLDKKTLKAWEKTPRELRVAKAKQNGWILPEAFEETSKAAEERAERLREEGCYTLEQPKPDPVPVEEELPPRRYPARRQKGTQEGDPPVFDGEYTIIKPGGDYRIVRVKMQPDEEGVFARGKQIVSLRIGPDQNWKGIAFIDSLIRYRNAWKSQAGKKTEKIAIGLLDLLLDTPQGLHLKEQGWKLEESRNCWRCGRTLNTPESIERGIGPKCAAKI